MSLNPSNTRARPRWLALLGGVAALMILTTGLALGVFLGDSNFEIDTNANLKVDGAASAIDWNTVNEIRKNDLPTGSTDDSFTQGTKEDTTNPTAEFGSIPPNKSDLKTFGIYTEEVSGDGNYLHLFWTRVQDPNGTTNMDFEFNQNKCAYVDDALVSGSICDANGITPARIPGDLLIVYELSRGGTVPQLALFTWLDGTEGLACEASNSFPCWGDRTDLDAAGAAVGSINTTAILAADWAERRALATSPPSPSARPRWTWT